MSEPLPLIDPLIDPLIGTDKLADLRARIRASSALLNPDPGPLGTPLNSSLPFGIAPPEDGTTSPVFRLLVTGSRGFDRPDVIFSVLSTTAYVVLRAGWPEIRLVNGKCPDGADLYACDWAALVAGYGWPVTVEAHPADWGRHGTRAGFIRNAAMVATQPMLCHAFIRAESPGATMTARMALKAGIPTVIWQWEWLPPAPVRLVG